VILPELPVDGRGTTSDGTCVGLIKAAITLTRYIILVFVGLLAANTFFVAVAVTSALDSVCSKCAAEVVQVTP